MNLVYGEIVDVLPGPELRSGKIRVRGAVKIISVDLLTDPRPGDRVLVCQGVAIGKIDEPAAPENSYVPGHTR